MSAKSLFCQFEWTGTAQWGRRRWRRSPNRCCNPLPLAGGLSETHVIKQVEEGARWCLVLRLIGRPSLDSSTVNRSNGKAVKLGFNVSYRHSRRISIMNELLCLLSLFSVAWIMISSMMSPHNHPGLNVSSY